MRLKEFRNYIIESKIELDKVIFPLSVQVRNAFFSVVAVVTAISIFLAIVDFVISFFVSKVV